MPSKNPQTEPLAGGLRDGRRRGQLAKYVNRAFEKCHIGRVESGGGGSDPADPAENTQFDPEGHLPSVTWDSGPRSAIVQPSWSSNEKQSNGDEDNKCGNKEASH